MRDYQQKVITSPTQDKEAELPPEPQKNRERAKRSTREKIEKLVSDGARNYPAYLKLVHTGDSDFSDDETVERVSSRMAKKEESAGKTTGGNKKNTAFTSTWSSSGDRKNSDDLPPLELRKDSLSFSAKDDEENKKDGKSKAGGKTKGKDNVSESENTGVLGIVHM